MRRQRLMAILGAAGLAVAGATSGSTAAAPGARAAACTTVTNLEFVNDDSGSMSGTDPFKNRVEAIKLLLGKAANRGRRTMGAVEFGSTGGELFPPTLIKQSVLTGLFNILDQRTQDDGAPGGGSGTDYDDGFAAAQSSNPNARARVFLTDGEHNGTYNNSHRNGPPTYVIGFGSSTSPQGSQRLQTIANETGGKYYPQTDSSNLTKVVDSIDGSLNCTRTKTFVDNFNGPGSKRHRLRLGRSTRSLEFTILWSNQLDSFDVASIRLVRRGRTIAVGSRRRPSRLRVRRVRGKTFVTLRVRGRALRRGKRRGRRIRFRVKGTRVNAPTQVTTNVSQSRRR